MRRAAKQAAPVRVELVKEIAIVITGKSTESFPNVLEACLRIGQEGKSGTVEMPGIKGVVKVTR